MSQIEAKHHVVYYFTTVFILIMVFYEITVYD